MTASEQFIADVIKRTGDADLTAAAAQMHTAVWWLAEGLAVVDRERYNEAMEAVG